MQSVHHECKRGYARVTRLTTLAVILLAGVRCSGGDTVQKGSEEWGPFVGPWKRYDKNPIIKLEDKEPYSIQNGPQTVIQWKDKWYMFLMTSQPMVTKLAVSDDGLSWKRPHHDYLLKPEMDWEGSYNLAKAAVVRDDEIWLYYFGKKDTSEMCALARSKDLIHWTKEPKPIFTHQDSRIDGTRAFPDSVIKEGDTWYMYYDVGWDYHDPRNPDGYVIGVATSKDGVTWKDSSKSPVLTASARTPDSWDDGMVSQCSVHKIGEWFFMLYSGGTNNDGRKHSGKNRMAFGLARARHPEGPWEKYPHNPVFKPTGNEKEFDGVYVQHACPVKVDGQWRLYYNGWTLNPKAKNSIGAEYAIGVAFANGVQSNTQIDWPAFLARHDMIWTKLPQNWREAPWTGNGMLGSMSWVEGDALRLQVFRGDVQAHRPMTQGMSAFTRGRLQIGSFYLKPAARPDDCDLRLSLYDAEVSGTMTAGKSALKIRQFTHAEDMVIVTELESADGATPVTLTWQPASSMPTRHGYAKTEAELPQVQKQYLSKYPTEVFSPNPDPEVKVVDGVNVCIQDMLGGSRHCTAWKMIETGAGKQRLAVSIANRWPKETNDPVAEAVAAVRKVCALDGNAYAAWKQKHYDWWHAYYPASFVSVPDTEVETVYWTTMYKLGSATRGDRVMIDTAGIWQTPSKWADSHWDLNIPYCYYPIPTANHVDLGRSLIRTFNTYQDNLIKNVRPVEWQNDSSYLPVTTGQDLYQPKDVDERYFQNTGGHLVWAMHACWLIYRGSMDDDMLRDTLYPIMKRAANYQIHRLEKRDGKYHAPKSHSPEYGDAPDASYELSMLRWICHAIVASGRRLGVEDAELAKYGDILSNLADYPVDERGYMVGEGMSFEKPHRHWCHLQMMHPLQLVTGKTTEERELMVRSVENFAAVNRNAGAAAFTFTGLSAMRALLGDGDRALYELHRFMNWPNLCPNSMYEEGNNPCLESPVYAAHNIHELLLQCYDEFPENGALTATIRIFPAVPTTWPDAVFHNLRTPGAFLVSAVRKGGVTQWVRVKSLAGEPCRIKPNLPGPVRTSGQREFKLSDLGTGTYTLDIKKGEEVLLYTGDTVPTPVITPLPAQKGKCNRYGLRDPEEQTDDTVKSRLAVESKLLTPGIETDTAQKDAKLKSVVQNMTTSKETLVVLNEHQGPVIGPDHPDVKASGNRSGFETGEMIKHKGIYHMFVNEMFGQHHIDMRVSHWSSPDAINWKRQSTVVDRVPGRSHTNPRSEVWLTGVEYNEEEGAWNIFFVSYRGGNPQASEGFSADYEGKIWRSRSTVKGPDGIAGPYKDVEIILQPDENTQKWEGQQAVDSFNPYQVGDKWYAFYGGHYHTPRGPWPVGLAWADKLNGPWKRMPEGFNPVPIVKTFVENPVVSKLPDGRYLAIFDSLGPREIGTSISKDGISWPPETRLTAQTGSNKWAGDSDHDMRTPLCAVREEDGTFTVIYTAAMKAKGFWAVGKCTLGWKDAATASD